MMRRGLDRRGLIRRDGPRASALPALGLLLMFGAAAGSVAVRRWLRAKLEDERVISVERVEESAAGPWTATAEAERVSARSL